MTVCLVLQGDSASPGAREKMCSGFRCWRKSMPSTHAGGWRGRGHLRLPEASPLGLQVQGPGTRPGRGGVGLCRDRHSETGPVLGLSSPPTPSSPALISKLGMKVSPQEEDVCFLLFPQTSATRFLHLFVSHHWGQAASLQVVGEERGHLLSVLVSQGLACDRAPDPQSELHCPLRRHLSSCWQTGLTGRRPAVRAVGLSPSVPRPLSGWGLVLTDGGSPPHSPAHVGGGRVLLGRCVVACEGRGADEAAGKRRD